MSKDPFPAPYTRVDIIRASRRKKVRLELIYVGGGKVKRVMKNYGGTPNKYPFPRRHVIDQISYGEMSYGEFLHEQTRFLEDYLKGNVSVSDSMAESSSNNSGNKEQKTMATDESGKNKAFEPVVVTGRLLSFGLEKSNASKPARRKPRYFAEVADDALGGKSHRIFGVDLERAIAEAKAEIGDHVEIRHHGYIKIAIPAVEDPETGEITRKPRRVNKKAFEINVLGRAGKESI